MAIVTSTENKLYAKLWMFYDLWGNLFGNCRRFVVIASSSTNAIFGWWVCVVNTGQQACAWLGSPWWRKFSATKLQLKTGEECFDRKNETSDECLLLLIWKCLSWLVEDEMWAKLGTSFVWNVKIESFDWFFVYWGCRPVDLYCAQHKETAGQTHPSDE